MYFNRICDVTRRGDAIRSEAGKSRVAEWAGAARLPSCPGESRGAYSDFQSAVAQANRLALQIALIVILKAEVGDQFFAPEMAQGVLELHQLNEQVVLWVKAGRGHRTLEVKRQPFLNA